MIDLTEELHRTTTDPTPRVDPTPSGAAAADPKCRCPICQKMFAESEIELHASECQGSLSEEGGAGSDDEIPRRRVRLARKAREVEPRGGPDTSRRSHQLTLGTFGSTSSRRVIRSGTCVCVCCAFEVLVCVCEGGGGGWSEKGGRRDRKVWLCDWLSGVLPVILGSPRSRCIVS